MTTIAIIALCIYALDRIGTHAWSVRWLIMHEERFAVMTHRDRLDALELEDRRTRTVAARNAMPGGFATYGETDTLIQLDNLRRLRRHSEVDDGLEALDTATRNLRDRLGKIAGDP